MLTRPQQILLKRAQAAAAVGDEDYRLSVSAVTGIEDCRSSTDPRVTDAHLDRLLKWFEHTYWTGVDEGRIQRAEPVPANHPFRRRGYWSGHNPKAGPTSRDKYSAEQMQGAIARAERALQRTGKDAKYLDAIRAKTGSGYAYLAALRRTLGTT